MYNSKYNDKHVLMAILFLYLYVRKLCLF